MSLVIKEKERFDATEEHAVRPLQWSRKLCITLLIGVILCFSRVTSENLASRAISLISTSSLERPRHDSSLLALQPDAISVNLNNKPFLEIERISSIQKALLQTHFPTSLAKNLAVTQLIDQFGLLNFEKIVSELDKELRPRLRDNEKITHGERLLTDAFRIGHPFKGVPVVVRSASNHKDQIQWKQPNEMGQLIPIGTSGLYAQNSSIAREHNTSQSRPSFESYDALKADFDELKANTPHRLLNDGCVTRCAWLGFLLENVMHYQYEKICVSHASEQPLKLREPFPTEPIQWRMHTVPVVFLSDGTKYVLDLSLTQPIPLNLWLSTLHTNASELLVQSYRNGWETFQRPGQAEGRKITLEHLLDNLRSLYLYENVDDNLPINADGSPRRTNTWMSWSNYDNGIFPVVKAQPQESCRVVVGFKKMPGNKIIPQFENIRSEKQFIAGSNGIVFQSLALFRKYTHYQKSNQLLEVSNERRF